MIQLKEYNDIENKTITLIKFKSKKPEKKKNDTFIYSQSLILSEIAVNEIINLMYATYEALRKLVIAQQKNETTHYS
mgnify:CR=1 FL=1